MVRKLCALMVLLFFSSFGSAHSGEYKYPLYADINMSPDDRVPIYTSPISMTVPYTHPIVSTHDDSDLFGVGGVLLFGFGLFFVLIASVMNTVFRD